MGECFCSLDSLTTTNGAVQEVGFMMRLFVEIVGNYLIVKYTCMDTLTKVGGSTARCLENRVKIKKMEQAQPPSKVGNNIRIFIESHTRSTVMAVIGLESYKAMVSRIC